MKDVLALLAALLAASCGSGGGTPEPGGLTADEAQALDEAAEMLQARRLPPEVLDGQGDSGRQESLAGQREAKPDA